ncbi:MAG TPA: S8 family serine peptidase, partial [Verrucomicrobiae bacterium]|nr:S8 family serine peptidase [Verrucomicrobiae bacterium]
MWRAALAPLFWLPVFLCAIGVQIASAAPRDISAHTRDQIQILQDEKASRTPAQRKIDSQLIYSLRERHQKFLSRNLPSLKPVLKLERDGRVLVDLNAEVTPGLLDFIRQNGGVVVNSFQRYRAVRALVPLDGIEPLAAQAEVRSVRPADGAMVNASGSVCHEGDIAHRADVARQRFGVDGTGIKIGVLSDSVDYLSQVQTAGQLSTVTVLPGQSGTGNGEGTAILEILHALAPGSDLYFATAFSSIASFAQNIRDLQAAGCNIIVDDVTYFNESPFQDGPIAQAVDDVSAAGVLFFSSAGNSGSVDHGTAGTWEGDFKDGGPATIGRGGRVHDFGGTNYNTLMYGGGSFKMVNLFWADPLGASTNDYDVYVLDSTGSIIASSTDVQDGTGDPYETIPFIYPGNGIVIVKYSGADRYLSLSTGRGVLAISTPGATHGHNASVASNAFCVAATKASSPPQPFSGGTANPVESFSSDGPRHMFFNPDGSAMTPGNFSSTGGQVFQKPDLTAADGVTTAVPSFPSFYGTSAAAPHAAAIAALLWSYCPFLSAGAVKSILSQSTLDIEQSGLDRDAGFGIVMADQALSAGFQVSIQSVQLQDANGNGSLDTNECADVLVTLQNPMSQSFTGITAVLIATTPEVLVDPAPRSLPALLSGGSATFTTPFRLSTTPSFISGTNAQFTLKLTLADQSTFLLPFQLSTLALGPPVTASSTTTPTDIPDLGSISSPVSVSGFDGNVGQIKVSVYITHPYDSDLTMTLLGPDGTSVLLSANNGDSGQNYGAACTNATVFFDGATASVASASAPFVGTFQPQEALSVFQGKSGNAVNGLWQLQVEDQVQGDVGTLQCWQLELSAIASRDGGGQCLVPPQVNQPPTNQFVLNGGTTLFTVGAQGTAPLSYQWYFNETNSLPDQTNATLVLSNATPDQTGDYTVVVSNPYGSVSNSASLLVWVPPTLSCGTNRTIELGAAWGFDAPVVTGSNTTLVLLGTQTNSGCGQTFTATRSWLATDQDNFQATCTQTVTVVDTTPPLLSCPGNKSVTNGTPWSFDAPTAQDASQSEVLVYDNWSNDLSRVLAPGSTKVGNEIILDSSERYPTRFAFQYWGTNTQQAGFVGNVMVEVRFYSNDGPALVTGEATPGSILYDSGLLPLAASPSGSVVVQDFQLNAAVPLVGALPDSFTWS